MTNPVHHIELWTQHLDVTGESFDWLLTAIGWVGQSNADWPTGRIWHHPSGAYLVLEQSPDLDGVHVRTHAGLNHLALRVSTREQLDDLRRRAPEHGWQELFAAAYPHAGGRDHVALFLANGEGFEMELVSE